MRDLAKTKDFKQIRQQLLEEAKAPRGTHCPLCRRFLKIYKRPINRPMTIVLALMDKYFSKRGAKRWLHVENYLNSLGLPAPLRGDFHKLRWWGLITKREGMRSDGNPNTGLYKITENGRNFLRGRLQVPSHAFMWGGPGGKVRLGFTKALRSVTETLGKGFSYAELMSSGAEELVTSVTDLYNNKKRRKRKV